MDKKIKFLRLDRQYQNLKGEILPAVDRVLSSGKVLQGAEVAELERDIAAVCSASSGTGLYAAVVGSGTDALVLAMKSLGISPGARVAVSSLSFIASASAIALAGGEPVFTDIDDKDYSMDADYLRRLIDGRRVQGVVAVHIFGRMLDTEPLYDICRRNGVFLVEDAAQCFGAVCRGFGPGVYSDAACVSFDPMKVIGAAGSGGAVVSRDRRIRDAAASLRYHGQSAPQEYSVVGHNTQMASVQAEILRIKIRRLAEWERERNRVASLYMKELSGVGDVGLPAVSEDRTHIWHKFVIRTGRRDDLRRHLDESGVETMAHYRTPLFEQPNMARWNKPEYKTFKVNKITKELLSLPIYPELSDDEALYVCKKIKEFYGDKI